MSAENWGAEPWRAPDTLPDDSLIFSECGRIIGKIDFRSHYLRLVVSTGRSYYLLVKHGAGQERISLGYGYRMDPVVKAMASMEPDALYLTMYTMLQLHSEGSRDAAAVTAARYRVAFAQGKLKKRKQRGGDAYKVWIEDRP